jgi:hypothetical protein
MPHPLKLPDDMQNIDWDPPPKSWQQRHPRNTSSSHFDGLWNLLAMRPPWWRGLPVATRKRLTLTAIGGWLVGWHVSCHMGMSPAFIELYAKCLHPSVVNSQSRGFWVMPSGEGALFGRISSNLIVNEIYYFSFLGFLIGLPLLWLAAYDWLRPLPQADPDRESSPTDE